LGISPVVVSITVPVVAFLLLRGWLSHESAARWWLGCAVIAYFNSGGQVGIHQWWEAVSAFIVGVLLSVLVAVTLARAHRIRSTARHLTEDHFLWTKFKKENP
jgi:hypothetical protein